MDFVFNRKYNGPSRGVILDWAGTTVDYGCFAPAGVFIEVFRQKGVDITIEEARAPMGKYKRDHIREVSRMARVDNIWREAYGKPCDESDIDDMFNNFIPLQLEVIAKYSDLIPDTLDAVAEFRKRGMKIGSTTGYNKEMMDLLVPEAAKRGYEPDSIVCASDVPAGRPAPWMAFKNAMNLNIYPMEAIVKIGDTIADIEEGLNAGMWSVGVILSGNELGMTLDQINHADAEELNLKKDKAKEKMLKSGAHYAIDSLSEVPALLDKINERLRQGERPQVLT